MDELKTITGEVFIDGIAQENRICNLSEDQEKALDFVDEFMKSNTKKSMVIGGCAGSGKSSIIPFIIDKYRSAHSFEIAYDVEVCAYTGKAVMVLKRKGIVDAKTLHSFLYRPVVKIDEEGNKIITYEKKHPFEFNSIKLLVVDEASMVNKVMYDFISSLPFKTIYIGDHFQLPPIDDNFNIMLNPDFKMEKVLRQNEDNPIIQLAEMARNGQRIPLGRYGSSKNTMSLSYEDLMKCDQVLTWTNAAKDKINETIRMMKKYDKVNPHKDDKMVVKVNAPQYNLFNGQIVYIMNDPKKSKNGAWNVELCDELVYNDPVAMAMLDEYTKVKASIHLSKEEIDAYRSTFIKNRKNKYQVHLDWGYALTVHSAQGSSWGNVGIILEKRLYHIKDAYRWLYTAITRAENEVTIYTVDKI